MSSVRNELESCSELFIHITGWSDSKIKTLLDGKKYVIELKLRICNYVTFKVEWQLTQGS